MKKHLVRLNMAICMLFIIGMLSNSNVQAETSGPYTYEKTGDTSIEITGFDWHQEEKSDVIIPSEIDGYTVTSIGEEAFEGCSYLISVDVPSTVTTIKKEAFANCTNLEKVTGGQGIVTIEGNAFYYDGSLTSFLFGDAVTSIGEFAFSETGLTSVVLPKNLITLGEYAFSYSKLVNVTISGSLKTIPTGAFYYGGPLSQITINEGVESIEADAFRSTIEATTYTMPRSLKNIDSGAIHTWYPDEVTIRCYYNSEAHKFAKNEGFKCVILDQPVESIKLDKTTASINIGKTVKITATVTPSTAIDKKITWSSSNTNVAKVDANGNVTGIAPGTAYINASAANGLVKVSCKITVNKPSLSKTSVTMSIGGTQIISVYNGTGTVTWKSSNTKVATVEKGKITGIKAGTATITAVSNGVTLSCKVTVTNPKLNLTKLNVYVGFKEKLTVSGGTGKITWKTSNGKIATVDASGNVKGIKAGTVTISAIRNGITMKCTVTVKNPELKDKSLTIRMYSTQKLVLNGVKDTKKIKWSSSNAKVVKVSSTGIITPVKPGTATVTATYNKKKYTCKVVVKSSSIKLNKTTLNFTAKGNQEVNVVYSKKGTLTYEVSNPNIVNVSWGIINGSSVPLNITPLKEGKTTIKIYPSNDKSDYKVIQVTVTKASISLKPSFTTYMSDRTDYTSVGVIAIINQGNKTMRIQKIGYSIDEVSEVYDREMVLIDENTFKEISYLDIKPGATAYVCFKIKGNPTWYDETTTYVLNMKYDSVEYVISASNAYGTLWWYK